jgi:hypothetical protein
MRLLNLRQTSQIYPDFLVSLEARDEKRKRRNVFELCGVTAYLYVNRYFLLYEVSKTRIALDLNLQISSLVYRGYSSFKIS